MDKTSKKVSMHLIHTFFMFYKYDFYILKHLVHFLDTLNLKRFNLKMAHGNNIINGVTIPRNRFIIFCE